MNALYVQTRMIHVKSETEWKKKILFESENVYICTDDNNNKIVTISSIKFKGKRSVDWKDVEGYLSRYRNMSAKILEKGCEIRIDGSFADEFCWSKDTKKLVGAFAKAKANAAQAIIELIENATNERYQPNMEQKHSSNAKYGWYRYTCRFQLPVMNEAGDIERFNQFRIEMVIRHASDHNRYLYDFVNIKKETSKPL